MARIDVLIPAYNAAATLRDAIESVRAQTVQDIRIVVVNDGSKDETPAIAAEIARQDRRVVLIDTPNRGIVEARNEALRNATADCIACLDADDIAFPHRLERELAYLDAHAECVAVGSHVEHVDEKGAALPGMTQPTPPGAANPARAPALEPYIIQSTLLARRADVEAVGGYRHVPNSEDSDLYWRLAERGALVNLTEKLGKYRVHTASVSSSIVNGRIMAIGSQLGAMSAVRRRAGKADLAFSYDLHSAMKDAATLEGMCGLAAEQLELGEVQHLRIAAATKLMELARYRPYELDATDCAFIRAALPNTPHLTPQNQKEVEWYITVTAARLVRKGMLSEALTLTPPKNYPVAAARVLLSR
jgi:glycosyltransferase involved in cell wall biosynthesis